jgi:hypothetical protein
MAGSESKYRSGWSENAGAGTSEEPTGIAGETEEKVTA